MSTTDFRSLQATFVPHESPGKGRLYFWCMPPRRVDYARKSLISLGLLRRGKSPPVGKVELAIPTPTRNRTDEWEVAELDGIRLPMLEIIRRLVQLDLADVRKRRISDSVRVWSLATKLAVELVSSGRIVPVLEADEKGKTSAHWVVSGMGPETKERVEELQKALPIAGHCLVREDGQTAESRKRRRKSRRRRRRKPITENTTIWRADALLRSFLDTVSDVLVREASPSMSKDRPRKDNRDLAPWEFRWRYALTAVDCSFENAGLKEQPLIEEMQRWIGPVRPRRSVGNAYTIAYQLEQPGSSPESSEVKDTWYLRYLLQANDDSSILIDSKEIWENDSNQLARNDSIFLHCREGLLESLAQIVKMFPPAARSLYSATPTGTLLTTEEAWAFISKAGPLLHQFGVTVRIQSDLQSKGQQRLQLKLHIGGDWNKPSKVGMLSLASFQWQVALGGNELTQEEFREIAAMKQPLVRWRGQWMAVDPAELSEMEKLFRSSDVAGTMDRSAALAAALTGNMNAGGLIGNIEVVAEGEIKEMIHALRTTDDSDLKTPEGFVGVLRGYQVRGLTWMSKMTSLHFGVCLADDMGLGKTIQVIALLLHYMESGEWDNNEPVLLVCPTSVLGNWEREIHRFAPELRVVRHHGRDRVTNFRELKRSKRRNQIILTTYVVARIDQKFLSKRIWSFLIIDEAQNIKNPSAKQAVALRSIPSLGRIALTGTPVENRLSELWSIMEFVNSGMLGPLGEFKRKFAMPIERFQDKTSIETLRHLVDPFILRRVKSDPNIIQDLPEKQEYKVFCSLTREQASLYQATVDNAMQEIESLSGVKRRGNILALLTALKQICNHPTHFLKEQNAELEARSGKLSRLTEMLEEVVSEDEHALIFTQYKKMGDLLEKHLNDTFDVKTPFIHGGVSARKRDQIVREFQENPIAPVLILSLKAGGTGLNLTRATHVFHFDRWWNPAVEDQATDRAYRIGQEKNVQVHKFICTGTIEDKIDEILESKRSLASSVVSVGESWITKFSDGELREMFSLAGSATIDDYDEEKS